MQQTILHEFEPIKKYPPIPKHASHPGNESLPLCGARLSFHSDTRKWSKGEGKVTCEECIGIQTPRLLFSGQIDNPADMKLMGEAFGAKALDRAFGDGGGGIAEITENATLASVAQIMNRMESGAATEASESAPVTPRIEAKFEAEAGQQASLF